MNKDILYNKKVEIINKSSMLKYLIESHAHSIAIWILKSLSTLETLSIESGIKLKILGRVYVAKEGINAQSAALISIESVPGSIESHSQLKDVLIKAL